MRMDLPRKYSWLLASAVLGAPRTITVQANKRNMGCPPKSSGVQAKQSALCFIHARRPGVALFEELHSRRMIRHGHVGIDSSLPRPVLKTWMECRQLIDIVPNALEDRADNTIVEALMAGQINIVGVDASVFDNRGRLAAL